MISDYGNSSPYIAALKGKLLSLLPGTVLVDIAHDLRPFDVMQAAFVLRNTWREFPAGTVHVAAIDTNPGIYGPFLIARQAGHYFLSADNGFFSLLFDAEPESVRKVNMPSSSLFPEKEVLCQVAVRLLQGEDPSAFSDPVTGQFNRQLLKPVVDGDIIRATIVYIDGYSNAFVNVDRELFEKTAAGRMFRIYYFGKNFIDRISSNYHEVAEGDEIALFNSSGYLEIATNKGRAAQLLGLKVGNKVVIEFLGDVS